LAIAFVFTSCGGEDDSGKDSGGTGATDPEEFAEDVLEDAARSDLEQAIGDRLAGLIQDEQLPYVVSQGPAFIETTEEQAAGTGLPAGTWLDIGFEFPIKPNVAHPNSPELVLHGPLDLYAEAVRPYIDQMDFVAMYWLPWLDASGSVVSAFNIYPEHMRQYLDGTISVEQLANKITIYGP
jgi:hypothetical protein